MDHSDKIVKAKSEIIDMTVKNPSKETLGEIKDIALDKISGQTLYVILESGGVLGMGSKLFALPWNALHYDTQEECFILNVNKEILKKANGFDKDHWPDKADSTFMKTSETTY